MKEVGAPKEYPISHLVTALGEDENFDTFVQKLCDEITETMDEREEAFEPLWADCEKNYWATGGPSTPKDSDLDFTITFETCKQASSNLSNPVFAQDTVFMVKARPGFMTLAATHDILLDWIADMSDYVTLVNDMIRHAQIYTKATVKSPWIRKTRKIKYWEAGENGEMMEVEREDVYKEGSFPYVVDPRRIYHPIPTVNIDDAPWWCEEFDIRVAEVKKKIKDGYYRSDLSPHAIGEPKLEPEKDKENEELYIANKLEGKERAQSELNKLKLMECYTTYAENEVVIILDLGRRTWLAAHSPFYQEFPRPYVTFCWHQVSGSIDGKSLCAVTDQLHRAYVACFNILLDAGVRSIEPLILALKELGLGEMLEDGRLGPGLMEVEATIIEKLADGIHEIKLTTGEVMFVLELMVRIEKHMRDASSIPEAFYGKELAQRPTATGTTSVLEKAMQPLYELMARFRPALGRIIEIQYSQLRQFKPKNLRIFVDAQNEETSSMMEAMLVEFPPGYWRDQVALETKVNSQTMSKAVKKQEALAMVDKWPELAQGILGLGEAAASGTPISPIAGNVLDVYDLVLKMWFTEFEMPEVRDALDIQGGKAAAESIAQAWQELQSIIEQKTQEVLDLQSQLIDVGEDPIAGVEPATGAQGRSGPSQAAA